jgi:hypothetical protein
MYPDKSAYYNEGYKAAYYDNKSQDSNPYPSTAEEWWKRDDWEKGWVDGDTDFYNEANDD